METNNKAKTLERLDTAATAIKEAKDFVNDEASVVDRVTNSIKDFTRWLGITKEDPTTEEIKEKVEEIKDKTADVAVEKTVEAVTKIAEQKPEEVKATQTDEVAKVAVGKTKDAVVDEVKKVKEEQKENIKQEAKNAA